MNSSSKLFDFNEFSNEDIVFRYSKRDKETKLGERITSLNQAKFIILGIEESIGPQANKGRSGAENGFEPFLSKFLNMQSNESLVGDNTCVLGKISCCFKDSQKINKNDAVDELDQFIYELLSSKLKKNQIPIVIGGGHNNAYPLMKYISSINQKKINVINLDPHADYRPLEGRHSGNSFSYAFRDGFLNKYSVFGLHQRYNSQRIIDDLKNDNHEFTFFEDYIDGLRDLREDIDNYIRNNKSLIGVELDLDAIEDMPSSAFTPSGISMEIARFYLRRLAKHNDIGYLHLPEGAPMNDVERNLVGKTLAYLVTDFISSYGALKL